MINDINHNIDDSHFNNHISTTTLTNTNISYKKYQLFIQLLIILLEQSDHILYLILIDYSSN